MLKQGIVTSKIYANATKLSDQMDHSEDVLDILQCHPFPDLRFNLSPRANITATVEIPNIESCSKDPFSSMFNIDPSVYGFTKLKRRRRGSRRSGFTKSSNPSTRERVECTQEDEEPAYCYHYWCETTPAITMYQV